MKPELQALVRLASLDERAAELRKEIAALPRHVAVIERKLEAHTRQLAAEKNALTANAKSRKAFEDEIKVHQGKISKLNDQMLQAKTNEQYKAFQHEISFCQDAISKAEDGILDLMGQSEPLEINVKAAEKALAEEKRVVEADKEDARKRTADDESQLQRVTAERTELAATVEPVLLARYEKARKKWGGGVADASSGACEACHISLRPQLFQELRRGEEILACNSCGRILYYNPPVNLEHELRSKA